MKIKLYYKIKRIVCKKRYDVNKPERLSNVTLGQRDSRGCDRIVVEFTFTCAISALCH